MKKANSDEIVVGVVSDTHGHVDPEVLRHLTGARQIIHAGDVGTPRVLGVLSGLAPVTAVRGNMDHGEWASALPKEAEIAVGDIRFLVGHILEDLMRRWGPGIGRFAGVVTGHTHRPAIRWESGILFLNPGSAGPKHSRFPRTLARIRVRGHELMPEIVTLGG